MSADDHDLIDAARAVIQARYRPGWHLVGAALRTQEGAIFTGVHLEANVGRIAVCAEAVALGHAVVAVGNPRIATIVAVYHPDPGAADQTIGIVAPCGMCREMIADYAPEARVILPSAGGGTAVPVATLIPHKFVRPV